MDSCVFTCVRCECIAYGLVFGIQARYCCYNCCKKFKGKHSKHYSRYLVSYSRALHLNNLSSHDLRVLNCIIRRNPVDPEGRPMRLYLGAEIEYLSECKKEECIREEMIERVLLYLEDKMAIERKKDQLEHDMGIRLEDMDTVLRTYLLDDFLKTGTGTKTTYVDVLRRFGVLERVQSILAASKWAHPGSVFDFCCIFPEGDAAAYQDFQKRCETVFYSVGDRILRFLSPEDRLKLDGLFLKKVIDDVRSLTMSEVIHWEPKYATRRPKRKSRFHKYLYGQKSTQTVDTMSVKSV